ncbi:uncharacterized protein LOC116217956 [Clupea harengus]|uniref:Uncharacterized protein LOC116217956 n=1 Tax=Clupea harengus TaxID=7950 RepID=A0A8M1K4G7_CLUHA|nr:uncharacterized protein LOC116217956 [Clupea harengus]
MTQNGLTGVFRLKKNQTVFFNESFTSPIQDRWHFVAANGTIMINPATKRDSGTYRVEIHNEETGALVANTTIQLIILGTHSTVRSILTDRTDNPSKMETRVCTHSTVRSILTDRTNNPSKMGTRVYMVSLIAASLGVVLLCVTVYGGVYYVCQRRTHTPKPAESVEVVYAEITVLKRENKQPEQRMKEEEGSVYSTHMSFSVAKADAEAD